MDRPCYCAHSDGGSVRPNGSCIQRTMFPVTVVFPKRFRSAACQVDELPEINAVLISHNHYDHLDANSVRTLNGRFGPRLRWYVPLGLKSWMRDMSCDNVVELDWWEEDVIPDVPDVKIAFVPSCH